MMRQNCLTCLTDVVQELRRSGMEISDEMEDDYYMSRLDAGLFTLQLVDYMMLDACHTGPSSVRHTLCKYFYWTSTLLRVWPSLCPSSYGKISTTTDLQWCHSPDTQRCKEVSGNLISIIPNEKNLLRVRTLILKLGKLGENRILLLWLCQIATIYY